MDKKLTDNEIIKALECCADSTIMSCAEKGCPFRKFCQEDTNALEKASLDLLNRKDAEIERLNVELVGMRGACESYKMHYDKAQVEIKRLKKEATEQQLRKEMHRLTVDEVKSEAIKEFAERLKDRFCQTWNYRGEKIKEDIDNLVKEMTGQNDFKE